MIMDKSGIQAKIGDIVYFINSLWDSPPYLQKGIISQVRVGCVDVEWELNSLQYNPKTNKHDIPKVEIVESRVKDNFIIKNK